MEVIKDITDIKFKEKTGVALGNFDGVHLGHISLIKHLKDIADQHNYKSLVFTFEDHTLKTLDPSKPTSLLTDNDKKIELIKSLDVDYLIMVKFDKKFSMMSYKDFIEGILVNRLNNGFVVVGSDFRFGRNGEGDTNVLKKFGEKYNYAVEVIPPVLINGVKVSSSYIRRLIRDGMVDMVPMYLGRNYSISGNVIKGNNYGTKLVGYPTANIDIDCRLCLPPDGVYVSRAYINGRDYHSVTDVGCNPTFHNKKFSIETYILDEFNENLYGKYIEVDFLKYIRSDIEFDNVMSLKEKIKTDVDYALNYFNGLDT